MTPIERLVFFFVARRNEMKMLRALPPCYECGHILASGPTGGCATAVRVGGALGDEYDCDCFEPAHRSVFTKRYLVDA